MTASSTDEAQSTTDDGFIHYDHIGHGSTPAAWTLCIIVIIASVIAGVGFILEMWILVWISIGLLPVALIAGVVMKKMGYGVEMDSNAVLENGGGPAVPDATSSPEKRKPAASHS